jgi:hypothetical protein
LAAAIVAAQFNSALGADDGSTVYSMALSAGSGLYKVDSSQPGGKGAEIQLSQSGAVISGKVGGDTYFTLTIDPATGQVTLDLLGNILHSNTADHDDAQSLLLDAGILQLVQLLTDGDGDSASASIDLGTADVLRFEDDGPSALPNTLVQLDDDALANGIAHYANALSVSGTLGLTPVRAVPVLCSGSPAVHPLVSLMEFQVIRYCLNNVLGLF